MRLLEEKQNGTKRINEAGQKQLCLFEFYSNIPDVSDEVFLSLPEDRDLALPLVATVS